MTRARTPLRRRCRTASASACWRLSASSASRPRSWTRPCGLAHGTDTIIIVRPRSQSALNKIKKGANGKPEQVKPKSLKPVDQYLGYKDTKGDGQDWVPFKRPEVPNPAEMRDLLFDEAYEVYERYHFRNAEYDKYKADIEHWMENDFTYMENGKPVQTRLGVDEDGFIILTHNGQRVVGDIDMLHVYSAKPGGGEIDPELFDKMFGWMEKDFDLKHGITLNKDFGVLPDERAVLDPVVQGHMLNKPGGGQGDALLAITPDGLVTTHVRNYDVNPNALPNHKTRATYHGLPAGSQ
jgi:hypothetical protein